MSWATVQNAALYTVDISGTVNEQRDTSKTTFNLADLPEGSYTLKVQARSTSDEVKDSKWSKALKFTREHESGMVFTLINNNTEYEVSSKGSALDENGVFVIPDTYRGRPVTSIGSKAFFNKNDVYSVQLGANIKNIGAQAFANCSYLKSVNLPNGLQNDCRQSLPKLSPVGKRYHYPQLRANNRGIRLPKLSFD